MCSGGVYLSRSAQSGRYQVLSLPLPQQRQLKELVVCHDNVFLGSHRPTNTNWGHHLEAAYPPVDMGKGLAAQHSSDLGTASGSCFWPEGAEHRCSVQIPPAGWEQGRDSHRQAARALRRVTLGSAAECKAGVAAETAWKGEQGKVVLARVPRGLCGSAGVLPGQGGCWLAPGL